MATLTQLVAYNVWASQKVGESIAELSLAQFHQKLGGSFPSIQETVQHLLQADWLWVQRLKESADHLLPADWETNTPAAIVSQWHLVLSELIQVAEQLENTPAKLISFKTRNGVPYAMPVEDIVQHVVNHGTYHRGQLINMLKMVGANLSSTDYILWWRTEK